MTDKTEQTTEIVKVDPKVVKERAKQQAAQYQRRSEIKAGNKGLYLTDLAAGYEIARAFASSGVLPKVYYSGLTGTPEENLHKASNRALVAMQLGAEIGLPPMQSIKAVTFINDMPVVWGDAQLAIVRASGLLQERVETYDEELRVAYCSMTRLGGEECSHTFSHEDAVRAKLTTKDNWSKFEKRMLQLRARAFCIRDLFTDVLGGLTHSAEEMGAGDFNNQEYTPELKSAEHSKDNNVFAQKLTPLAVTEQITEIVEVADQIGETTEMVTVQGESDNAE